MVEKGDKALVNKRESNKLTLNALRRSDATIEDIIGTAHQVCLYEFQLDRQTWVCGPCSCSCWFLTENCCYMSCHLVLSFFLY